MTYLQRIDYRPSLENLSVADQQTLQKIFDAYGAEMLVYGDAIRWEHIDEVEVVIAPHATGLAGWIVKKFIFKNQERYHVGVYYGSHEAVLPNVTWDVARYVVEMVAYYAPQSVQYKGPDDLVKLSEI